MIKPPPPGKQEPPPPQIVSVGEEPPKGKRSRFRVTHKIEPPVISEPPQEVEAESIEEAAHAYMALMGIGSSPYVFEVALIEPRDASRDSGASVAAPPSRPDLSGATEPHEKKGAHAKAGKHE